MQNSEWTSCQKNEIFLKIVTKPEHKNKEQNDKKINNEYWNILSSNKDCGKSLYNRELNFYINWLRHITR
jgi:hypothetical protein